MCSKCRGYIFIKHIPLFLASPSLLTFYHFILINCLRSYIHRRIKSPHHFQTRNLYYLFFASIEKQKQKRRNISYVLILMYECVLVCKCLPFGGRVLPLSLPPSLSIPQYDDVSFRIGMFYFIFPYPSLP